MTFTLKGEATRARVVSKVGPDTAPLPLVAECISPRIWAWRAAAAVCYGPMSPSVSIYPLCESDDVPRGQRRQSGAGV